MKTGGFAVSRRELLAGGSLAMLCGCASIPFRSGETVAGGGAGVTEGQRGCNHDGCRYFVATAGEEMTGRCRLGLPEEFR